MGAGAALVAAGCRHNGGRPPTSSSTGTASTGSASTGPASTGPDPVASWRLVGGFTFSGLVAIRPHRLVVYATGEAVADAAHRLRLPAPEVGTLTEALISRLADGRAGKPRPGAPMAIDAPATEIVVRGGNRTYTVQVEALDELRGEGTYEPRLYEARDRLDAVYRRVVAEGAPYTSARVRVVVMPAQDGDSPPVAAQPWPAGVPVPATKVDGDAAWADLDGDQARRALAALPMQPGSLKEWKTYQTPDGRRLQAALRYLLPHE